MNSIIRILKPLIISFTILVVVLYAGGIDSIYDKGFIVPATCGVALLVYICYTLYNIKEQE